MFKSVAKFLKQQRGILVFLFGILFFRTAIADWNPIPSSSMEPTLFPGDVVLIDKTQLGPAVPFTTTRLLHIAEPQRGDIVTFRSPANGDTLIKRVIGLAGDRIRTEGPQVFVNGTPLPLALARAPGADGVLRGRERIDGHEHAVQFDTWRDIPQLQAEVTVPAGSIFVMGDFRNNSVDSRFFGFVPLDDVSGQATRIAVSIADERSLGERIGTVLQ